MLQRIKNATIFYGQHYQREIDKELQLVKALANGKPNISYMGWTGFSNLGDEILYEAHQQLFPRLNVVPFRQSAFETLYKVIFRKDQLYQAGFLGGGTLINQSDSWIEQIKYLETWNVPIYCLGTGVTDDEFRATHEKTSLKKWSKVLDRFVSVGIRGPYSQQMLRGANFTKATIVGDTALALAPTTYASNQQSKIIGINYGLIGENNIWGSKDEYINNMVDIIKQLIGDGYTIHLLPVWNKDIPSNKALLKLVDSPKCKLICKFDTLKNYQAELQRCSLFLGQKLHATIMACMLRIPSIMIEYQPKCRDFMASIDMEQWVIKTSECQPSYVLSTLNELRAQYDTVQTTLDERVMYYRSTQQRSARQIEESLLG